MAEPLDAHSPVSVAGAGHDGSLDDLEEGSMVVMYFGPGMLAAVRPTGKYWELEPLSIPDDSEAMTMHFFPSEAVFTVVRKGRYIGFKSIAAEGRTLQAIGGEEDAPLRVNNYNFGTWEMWESTASGFVNRKWPQKHLGLDVSEVQIVSLENLRSLERHTLRASRDMQTKIKSLEVHRHKLEREIGDLNRSKRRQATQHARELEDHKSRLDEALATKQKLEVEGVHTGTKLRRQELLVTQLTLQRDNANARLADIEANQRSEQRQLEAMREKFETEIDDLKRSHQKELQAFKVEKEQEVDRSMSRTQEELHVLRQKLEQAESDREQNTRRLQADQENILRQRAFETDQLRDENRRLVQALQTIQHKVQSGFHALSREDYQPSAYRHGADERLRSCNGSPLHSQRLSPAPSRNSMRRGDEFPDAASQAERCLHSSESVGNGYLDRGQLGHYDTFSARSSLEGASQRRADSRASDTSKRHLMHEDPHNNARRFPAEMKRQPLPFSEPNSARYPSQLVSIEDEEEEEQPTEDFKDLSYEVDSDEGRSSEEEDFNLNENTQHRPHGSFATAEDGLSHKAEDSHRVLSTVDSEVKTIDSESEANGDNNSSTHLEELLTEQDKRSDTPQSMVEEEKVTANCLLADAKSQESIQSGTESQLLD